MNRYSSLLLPICLMVALIISCSSQAMPSPTLPVVSTSANTIQPPVSASTDTIRPTITASPPPTEGTTLVSPVITAENAHLLTEAHRLTEHDDDIVGALAFSPDGTILATGGNAGASGGNIRLWDPRTGELLATLSGHTDNVNALAFSPDGAILASGSSDHTVRLWDVLSRETIAILKGHTDFISAMAISPDGRWLASGSQDKQFILWDMQKHSRYASIECLAPVSSIAFSPDGTQVAVAAWGASPDIQLMNVPILTRAKTIDLPAEGDIVRAVAYNPDGRSLAAANVNKVDPTVQIFGLSSGSLFLTLRGVHHLELNSVAFSPDGYLLVSTSADNSVAVSMDWEAVHPPSPR